MIYDLTGRIFEASDWEGTLDPDFPETANKATFRTDFGVFRKGEKCDCICVNFATGLIHAYVLDGEGEIAEEKTQGFKLAPL